MTLTVPEDLDDPFSGALLQICYAFSPKTPLSPYMSSNHPLTALRSSYPVDPIAHTIRALPFSLFYDLSGKYLESV